MFPATVRRVEQNTAASVNRRVRMQIERSLRHHAAHPEEIGHRLAELDREWDIERTLETNAATLALAGTLLGAFYDRRFLALPALVSVFLLQHALQGWCPPVPFFRRRGVRTATEIDRERYALKLLRGDFDRADDRMAGNRPSVAERAAAALQAACA